MVLVTHYQRLLNYIVPDYVHVMDGGRIVKTGGKDLALDPRDARVRLDRRRIAGRRHRHDHDANRAFGGLPRKPARRPADAAGESRWRRSTRCAPKRSTASAC